ncbi:transcription initiation factor TFIID subunit 12 isoform X4 [Diospyros lotus]|nr:transcription initiation factor TFIID subunit 12 isoform X4 [Diospyros lotus]
MPPPPPQSSSSSTSPSPPPVPPFSSSGPSSVPAPSGPRGGMAIGVPAHHPSPTPASTSFSSLGPPAFGQQFGGLARNPVVSESVTNPSSSQPRQPIQGMGSVGSFGSGPPIRPGGIAVHHQQRPLQSSVRPQSTQNNLSSTSQSFQGHGLLRVATGGSPVSPSPSTSQSMQSHNQPWLSPGPQGKPPLPPTSFRPQINQQSLQQRSHIPQQHHHPILTASQQPQTSTSQQPQQPSSSLASQDHHGQQFQSSRIAQSLSHQQQFPRGPGFGNSKPSSNTVVQPSTMSSGVPGKVGNIDTLEPCDRILSKRSIQELLSQIDPSEKLDPEVEDVLVDIAEEFVESITTAGCALAKHRKSTTLEAKDILLHLERNWNMTLPGFSGDEIRTYKKPSTNDIHRERLAVIKKSITSADQASSKTSTGQAAGTAKGHLGKAPNVLGSPNPKMRESA